MAETASPLFVAASTLAPATDRIFVALLLISAFFFVLITSTIIYFSFRYHKSSQAPRGGKGLPVLWLELTWSVVPLIIVLGIFVWGAVLFQRQQRSPVTALEINVTAKQWMWKIQHPSGRREINALHIPKGQPIKLVMISQDVIHSFFVPAFRLKQDVLPGRYTTLWFEATKTGTFHLFCAEYCGTSHARMGGGVTVLEPAEYEKWSGGQDVVQIEKAVPPSAAGEALFKKFSCLTCHKTSHTARGPALAGLFGSRVQLKDGREVTADESYLRESIMTPSRKIVSGYDNIMPTFQGLIEDEDVSRLIAYIKSLKTSE